MDYRRIIPCLDVKDGRLVKGVNFVELKYVGDPAENAAAYSNAVEWAKKAEDLGAGAVLPTSMDADGTQAGYDIPMTRAIADAVALPVIASGGAGTLEHLYQAIVDGGADAVLVASIAHFGKFTIRQMKEYLARRQIPVNL